MNAVQKSWDLAKQEIATWVEPIKAIVSVHILKKIKIRKTSPKKHMVFSTVLSVLLDFHSHHHIPWSHHSHWWFVCLKKHQQHASFVCSSQTQRWLVRTLRVHPDHMLENLRRQEQVKLLQHHTSIYNSWRLNSGKLSFYINEAYF